MSGLTAEQDREKWIQGWAKLMVDIWIEKVTRLYIIDTGSLMKSISQDSISGSASVISIAHSFLDYGIYVDKGVGKEFRKGNGGDLGFYPTREAQKWFSIKYYASFMNLKEYLEKAYADNFVMMMKEALEG